jgi:hypothetical protein
MKLFGRKANSSNRHQVDDGNSIEHGHLFVTHEPGVSLGEPAKEQFQETRGCQMFIFTPKILLWVF